MLFRILGVTGAAIIIAIVAFLAVATYRPDLLPPVIAQYQPMVNEKTQGLQQSVNSVRESRIEPLGQSLHSSQIFSVDQSQQKPIHQKAFEYARYEYCQQVVKDYEAEKEKGSE